MLMKIARITIALALSGQVAIAFAAIPGVGGVISACFDSKGIMRVIDAEAGQVCSNKETPITMNQAGQTGSTGPTGPVGPSDAYVTDFGGFSPFRPIGLVPIVLLEVPAGGEYVIEALMRFRANNMIGEERANINCELRADVSGTGELDIFTVSFNAEEYNGYVKLAPMVAWVKSATGFFIHVDCEIADGDGIDDIGIDESRLVAVRYGEVHVPTPPPPPD
jgi:hypothetical protein